MTSRAVWTWNDAIPSRLKNDVDSAVRETAEYIAQEARRLAPVDTGYLRRMIDVVELSSTRFEVVADAEYSEYIEFGTINQRAQPFLTPAYVRGVVRLKARLSKLI